MPTRENKIVNWSIMKIYLSVVNAPKKQIETTMIPTPKPVAEILESEIKYPNTTPPNIILPTLIKIFERFSFCF